MLNIMHHGEEWRRQRRIMQQVFNSQSVKNFEGTQTDQVKMFLNNLLDRPKELFHVINM